MKRKPYAQRKRTPQEMALRAKIGENIHRFREKHGMSVGNVADRCGIYNTHVYNIEAGTSTYTLPSLIEIGSMIGMSHKEILSDCNWELF